MLYQDIITIQLPSSYNIYKPDNHCVLRTNRTIFWSMMVLMPLLGISWILGLFFIIDSDSVAFAWIFTIVNSLQVQASQLCRNRKQLTLLYIANYIIEQLCTTTYNNFVYIVCTVCTHAHVVAAYTEHMYITIATCDVFVCTVQQHSL